MTSIQNDTESTETTYAFSLANLNQFETFFKGKKLLVVTHAVCNDGLWALCVVLKKFDVDLEHKACFAGNKIPNIDKLTDNTVVLCVDFLPQMDDIIALVQNGVIVFGIDHHDTYKTNYVKGENVLREHLKNLTLTETATTFELRADKVHIFQDFTDAACSLVWKTFFPDRKVPEILFHIARNDMGDFSHEKTKAVCLALWGLAYTDFNNKTPILEMLDKTDDELAGFMQGACSAGDTMRNFAEEEFERIFSTTARGVSIEFGGRTYRGWNVEGLCYAYLLQELGRYCMLKPFTGKWTDKDVDFVMVSTFNSQLVDGYQTTQWNPTSGKSGSIFAKEELEKLKNYFECCECHSHRDTKQSNISMLGLGNSPPLSNLTTYLCGGPHKGGGHPHGSGGLFRFSNCNSQCEFHPDVLPCSTVEPYQLDSLQQYYDLDNRFPSDQRLITWRENEITNGIELYTRLATVAIGGKHYQITLSDCRMNSSCLIKYTDKLKSTYIDAGQTTLPSGAVVVTYHQSTKNFRIFVNCNDLDLLESLKTTFSGEFDGSLFLATLEFDQFFSVFVFPEDSLQLPQEVSQFIRNEIEITDDTALTELKKFEKYALDFANNRRKMVTKLSPKNIGSKVAFQF